MIRIMIADDYALVRKGLIQIVSGTPDMQVVDEASSVQEVLSKTRHQACDVLVLDLSLPDGNGLDVLRELRANRKDRLPVLVLSMYAEDEFAVLAFRAGADGYLTKNSNPEELVTAIRKISEGGKVVDRSLAEKLAGELANEEGRPLHERLSPRELQVMRAITSGQTSKQVADALGLSPKTISTHRARILSKMGLKSSAEMIHYAVKHGLLD